MAVHAAVVTLNIDPDRAPEAAGSLVNDVVPRLKASPGFIGGHWMEPQEGRGLAVLFFETEEQARQGALIGISDQPVPGVAVQGVEVRRVAMSV